MSRTVLGAVGVLLFATLARGQLVVELVPDNPGPYYGGETLTVDVWLHSEVGEDFRIHILRLDFTDTDPAKASFCPSALAKVWVSIRLSL